MDRSDLEYIRILNDKINEHLERIEFLKSKAFPGAIRYDDIGGSKPTVFDTLGDLYSEIDLEERKADKLIDRRHELKLQAIKVIRASCTDIKHRHVLYLRYLGTVPHTRINLEWPEIRKYMNKRHNIQRRQVQRIHHDAVMEVKHHNMLLTDDTL